MQLDKQSNDLLNSTRQYIDRLQQHILAQEQPRPEVAARLLTHMLNVSIAEAHLRQVVGLLKPVVSNKAHQVIH